eukprot:5810994-Karenia_brevis.AAC.1
MSCNTWWKSSSSFARESSPATTRRFWRSTRNENRSTTHGTTMKGGFDVAGGLSCRFRDYV